MRKIFKTQISVLLIIISSAPVWCQHVSHSVLAQGSWWKIGVTHDGLYRLTADDVPALQGSNVADIALFGQRGGLMALSNSSWRMDDLDEMPIEAHDGNGNGVFDNEDYILFYACGPGAWGLGNDRMSYQYQSHPYSDANYVFLTITPGSHSRVATTPHQQPTGTDISSAHTLMRHERDIVNTHRTGQIWVGEKFFSSNTQHSFSFQLPAPATSLSVRYGLASLSDIASSFTATFNGVSATHGFNKSNRYATFSRQLGGSAADITATIKYSYGESLAEGYLDFIELDAVTTATMSGTSSIFRLPATDSLIHTMRVDQVSSGVRVWDVSDYNNIYELQTEISGGTASFSIVTDHDNTILVFMPTAFSTPASVKSLANQDLHGSVNPDMVVVCHPLLRAEAQRLASLHSIIDGLEVLVVSQDEVFNEFSGGRRDPMAVRELMRMFRQRATQNSALTSPKHLLLFGKGTYDNRNLLGNSITDVVTYESELSFNDDGSGSISTDDIFTFLDDNEAGSIYESLDISVGRLPAKNSDEASHIVDKIEGYMFRLDLQDENIRGDWRNIVTLLSDDADPGIPRDTDFTWSSEVAARQVSDAYPHLTIEKIYADAYPQQSGADGSFYPDVNNALKKRMDYGCLLLNYIGHGSSQYIGTERFMMKSDIAGYANRLQLPFFITSTCTFGRFDDPAETCGAEEFLLADGAGIGCIAASRPISHVQSVNTAMIMQCLNPDNTIGDGIRKTKNLRPTTQALTLMGDPALKLSQPEYKVVVTAINGKAVDSAHTDTALVLSTVTVEGEIRDKSGVLVEDFDGTLYPVVFDRPKKALTLANDNDGCEVSYSLQNNMLYKGSTPVTGGKFSYRFVVPRDVPYSFERCRMAHYAKSAGSDATGAYLNLLLGGFDENAIVDELHPEMRLFINDTNFRNGGITAPDPTLLVMLHDSVGINSVGSGLGHDITAILDDNPNNIIILNDLYETDINNDHSGSIRYTFSSLTPGRHTIAVKAWNIFNQSTSGEISFVVRGSDSISTHLHVMPNPATEQVYIRLETNTPLANATLDIFDIQGRHLFSATPIVDGDSYVAGPVMWRLNSTDGSRVPPGIYLARFSATTTNGDKVTENGKIIVK